MDDWNWETNEFNLWMNNEKPLYDFLLDCIRQTDEVGAEWLQELAADNISTYGDCFYMDQDQINKVDFKSIIMYNRED